VSKCPEGGRHDIRSSTIKVGPSEYKSLTRCSKCGKVFGKSGRYQRITPAMLRAKYPSAFQEKG